MITLDNDILGFVPATRFERIARAQPDALALAQGPLKWTYGDILDASGRYAQVLSAQKVGDEVALVFGHNAEAIIAMMGAIRAGVLCIPIDPLAPPLGVEQILPNCQLILTEEEFLPWCKTVGGETPILNGPEAALRMPSDTATFTTHEAQPDSPCVVYFSSGSTGVPKGAPKTQRQIKRSICRLTETQGYGPADRQALFASFAFAGSFPVVLGGLLTGGGIDIIDLRNKNTLDFVTQICERGITILTVTSSLLRALVDSLAGTTSGWQPRLISVSGEPLLTQDILKMRQQLGWSSKVVHRLASSEVGVVAEWEVDLELCDPHGVVPVGYANRGLELSFIDEDGTEVPQGHIGELVITGQNISDGYWKRPDLTQKAYVNIPTAEAPFLMQYRSGDLGKLNSNGLLEFMGRKGSMVKIRGYSIDKDAVETAMRQIEGVVNAIVVVQPGRNDNDFLLGYVQQSRWKKLMPHAVRTALREILPEFMLPKRIVVLDYLPLTAGGKIDRANLPAIDRSRPLGMDPVVPPVGATEIALAQIWSEVLEINDISRNDSFFELGGDSLDVLSVALSLHKEMGVELNESELFFVSDLTGMAKLMKAGVGKLPNAS